MPTLSPTRWHSKHICLSSLGMLGRNQLNSILFEDHTTFKNGYLKRAKKGRELTNNNNKNKRKQV